jgi:hypothetical protein
VARKATWFLIVLVAVIGGFALKAVVDVRGSTREFRAFADKVAGTESLSIHEGLPSPYWESGLFESESGKGLHATYDGFAFYKEPRLIVGQEATELTRRIREVAIPYRGAKACGQFHPDFMAEWKVDGGSYRIHVCFSCHELRVVGPNSDFLMDIDDGEFPAAVLDRRRRERLLARLLFR